MKSVLRSIKPYWLYLILIGKKSVEVGKDCPKSKDWNRVVELYCCKDKRSFNRIPEKDKEWMRQYLGKVVCRFVCKRISLIDAKNLHDYCQGCEAAFVDGLSNCDYSLEKIKEIGLSSYELSLYIGDKNGYEWHISDLVIYDKPLELSEFVTMKKCTSCKRSGYESTACIYDENCLVPVPLIRPPQSWCYVDELNE